MGVEIERKFLVDDSKIILPSNGSHIIQGYLTDNNKNSIRVRRIDKQAYITIKSAKNTTIRAEFEYPITSNDANYMLKYLCLNSLIEKTRYKIHCHGHDWCIDKFEADNKGLMIAEIELGSKREHFKHPEWLLNEVTENDRYYNSYLAKHTFSTWLIA